MEVIQKRTALVQSGSFEDNDVDSVCCTYVQQSQIRKQGHTKLWLEKVIQLVDGLVLQF